MTEEEKTAFDTTREEQRAERDAADA